MREYKYFQDQYHMLDESEKEELAQIFRTDVKEMDENMTNSMRMWFATINLPYG